MIRRSVFLILLLIIGLGGSVSSRADQPENQSIRPVNPSSSIEVNV